MGMEKSMAGIEYKIGSVNSIPAFLASINPKKNGKNIRMATKQMSPAMVLVLNERYTHASFHLTMYFS